ncbi:MAG: glucose-6-phosphate dehydrogenase [Candidatus Tyrphobacter sp.]
MLDTSLSPASGDGERTNPLRAGIESDRISDPCSVVLFGASGDLFKRMLLPAIWALRLRGILPSGFALIGFARTKYSDQEFRDYCREQIDAFAPDGSKPQGELWESFAQCLSYVTADFKQVAHFQELRKRLDDNDKRLGTGGNRLFYLATPPSVFPGIIEMLRRANLDPRNNERGWTRIVIEKPFGTDLASARALQKIVDRVFGEHDVYRIDHYLGKEPVQDIMALRFANTIFEPIWNRNYVQSVQITSAESIGIEDRGSYYENAGALRDMIQNHVLNLLALVAMEPPASSEADAIRNEKLNVFSAIAPPHHEDVMSMATRGQYGAGIVDGAKVPGYRDEPGVAPNSNTETFAALRVSIDNWRWAGVPFYLRSGKRLARKMSEIVVTFKPIPHRLYGESTDAIEPNILVIKIEPDEGVALRFEAKVPGPKSHIRSVFMDFNYGTGFGFHSPPAYERLLADAMRGDQTLFTRWDAVELAWEIITPVLDVWQNTKDFTFPNYAAGSQGPDSASRLLPEWRRL